MLFPTFVQDANKTATALMQAGMENIRTTQEAIARQGELASKMETPWQVKWTGGAVPMPTLSFTAASAESTREAFHLMADANMKAWEQAAEAWSAMPSWVKLPYKAPGEFWSKWFDQWQDGKFDSFTPETAEAAVETMTEAVKKASGAANDTVEATPAPEPELDEQPEFDDKPALFDAPQGEADDLTAWKGIGPKLSAVLNDLGVWHYSQIASWTPENIAWLDEKLAFKGRIYREAWVDQAQSILKSAA